mmetsp:Transcript_30143/g.85104  ORF Transcript_30143/g.85104 Transcript_30143/m.85104 type:complete len:233 (-) Transcript_30143:2746-3444(-)
MVRVDHQLRHLGGDLPSCKPTRPARRLQLRLSRSTSRNPQEGHQLHHQQGARSALGPLPRRHPLLAWRQRVGGTNQQLLSLRSSLWCHPLSLMPRRTRPAAYSSGASGRCASQPKVSYRICRHTASSPACKFWRSPTDMASHCTSIRKACMRFGPRSSWMCQPKWMWRMEVSCSLRTPRAAGSPWQRVSSQAWRCHPMSRRWQWSTHHTEFAFTACTRCFASGVSSHCCLSQ